MEAPVPPAVTYLTLAAGEHMHKAFQFSGSNLHTCGWTGREFTRATGLIKYMRFNFNSVFKRFYLSGAREREERRC